MASATDVYARAKDLMSESQSTIDALVQFMTARATLEDGYAKSLSRLAKQPFAMNGAAGRRLERRDRLAGRRASHLSSLPTSDACREDDAPGAV